MIKQDVTIGAGKRQCLPELLDDPLASWMCRAVEMKKASPAMFDDKEAVESLKRQCWNCKKVEGGNHFAMVVQEHQPALGFTVVLSALDPFEIAGDGRFGDLESELEQLAVDARRTPDGIFILHLPNEKANLCTDPAPARWPRLPTPKQAEASTVPGDHCFGFNQNEGIGPTGIPVTQCDPEEPVETIEPRARLLAFEYESC